MATLQPMPEARSVVGPGYVATLGMAVLFGASAASIFPAAKSAALIHSAVTPLVCDERGASHVQWSADDPSAPGILRDRCGLSLKEWAKRNPTGRTIRDIMRDELRKGSVQ